MKFKKGDVIVHPTTCTGKSYTVVDPEPDLFGHIVAKDNRGVYCTFPEHVFDLKPAPPKRFVVELRTPKRGERYFYDEEIMVGDGSHKRTDTYPDRLVIVQEL